MRPVEAWQVHLRVAGTAEGGRRAVALAPVIDAAGGPLIATGDGGFIAAESFARAVARLAPAARLALREHADGRADIGVAVRIPSVALAEATGWLVVRGRGRAAGPLRKAIWNPAHHPRHPAGSPDSTGGEFAPVHGGGRGGSGGQRASAGGPRDSRNPGRPAGRVADENRHHLTSAEYRVLGDLEAAIERTRSELYVPAGGRGRRPPGEAPQDGLRDALEILENSRGPVGVGA